MSFIEDIRLIPQFIKRELLPVQQKVSLTSFEELEILTANVIPETKFGLRHDSPDKLKEHEERSRKLKEMLINDPSLLDPSVVSQLSFENQIAVLKLFALLLPKRIDTLENEQFLTEDQRATSQLAADWGAVLKGMYPEVIDEYQRTISFNTFVRRSTEMPRWFLDRHFPKPTLNEQGGDRAFTYYFSDTSSTAV